MSQSNTTPSLEPAFSFGRAARAILRPKLQNNHVRALQPDAPNRRALHQYLETINEHEVIDLSDDEADNQAHCHDNNQLEDEVTIETDEDYARGVALYSLQHQGPEGSRTRPEDLLDFPPEALAIFPQHLRPTRDFVDLTGDDDEEPQVGYFGLVDDQTKPQRERTQDLPSGMNEFVQVLEDRDEAQKWNRKRNASEDFEDNLEKLLMQALAENDQEIHGEAEDFEPVAKRQRCQ